MANINGKWKLVSRSNMEAFHNAIHTPPEFKEKALAFAAAIEKDPVNNIEEVEVNISDGKISRSIIINGEKKWGMGYKIGVEEEMTGPDGRITRGISHVVNDNKITFQGKGSDFETSGIMEVVGNELTLTLIGNGVTAHQKFIRV